MYPSRSYRRHKITLDMTLDIQIIFFVMALLLLFMSALICVVPEASADTSSIQNSIMLSATSGGNKLNGQNINTSSSSTRVYSKTIVNGEVVESIDKIIDGIRGASISVQNINSNNSNTMQSNVNRSYATGTSSSDVSSMFVDLQRPETTTARQEIVPARDLMRSVINFLKHVIALF